MRTQKRINKQSTLMTNIRGLRWTGRFRQDKVAAHTMIVWFRHETHKQTNKNPTRTGAETETDIGT